MEDRAQDSDPRILSVGQCGFDQRTISGYLASRFQARVDGAAGPIDARAAVRSASYSLVLINRIIDRDGSSGLDLIAAFKADPQTAAVPIMLVSDLAEAQEAACRKGAVPGFGKSSLYQSETFERIKQALGE